MPPVAPPNSSESGSQHSPDESEVAFPRRQGALPVYRLVARLVLAVHTTWVVFLLGGFALGRQNRWLRPLRLGGLLFNMVLRGL